MTFEEVKEDEDDDQPCTVEEVTEDDARLECEEKAKADGQAQEVAMAS